MPCLVARALAAVEEQAVSPECSCPNLLAEEEVVASAVVEAEWVAGALWRLGAGRG